MLRRSRALPLGVVVFAFLFAQIPSANATTTWTAPLELSAPSANSNAPQVASDSSGNFVTLYAETNGANSEMRSTSSIDFGSTWSSPITISTGTSVLNPRVISVGARAFVAVWNQFDGTSTRVVSSKTSDNGLTWSAPIYISVAGQNTRVADIAFDGHNSLGLVWTRQLSGFTYSVSASGSSDLGITWATPQDLTAATPGAISPQITSSDTGSFVALWHRLNTPVTIQSSSTTNSGATWSVPIVASDSSTGSTYPQLVSTSTSKIVALWFQNISSSTVLSSSISIDNGATWSTPVQISDPTTSSYESQLIKAPNGALISVWYQNLGSGNQIFFSKSADEGLTWSSPTTVSSQTDCYNPQIESDSNSNLTAAWWCGQGSNATIAVATSTDNAVTWSSTTSITQSPLFGNFVSLAVSPTGDSTVAWQMNYSGSLYKVYASSFIVSYVPPQPQPQPNTLPPTGVSSNLLWLSGMTLATGMVLLLLRKRVKRDASLAN